MPAKQRLKLGDAIARVARALQIPHCEKCERRRLILNEIGTLGMRETIKRLKAVGFSKSKENPDEAWSVEEIVKKMEDCCDE